MHAEPLLCAVCFLSAHSLYHSGTLIVVMVTLANTCGSAVCGNCSQRLRVLANVIFTTV